MSEQGHDKKERYSRVRTDFDELDTEDKVVFLMEATVSTVARGIDEFGRAVSDEINKAFRRRAEKKSRAEKEETGPTGTTEGPTPESPASESQNGAGSESDDTKTDMP